MLWSPRVSSCWPLLLASTLIIAGTYLVTQNTQLWPYSSTDSQTTAQSKNGNASNTSRPSLKLVPQGETSAAVVESMTPGDADNTYYNFLMHLHYKCEDYVRLGLVIDGGWDVCIVSPYQLVQPCLVYSFGINWDFSFDDAVSNKFGCTVRAFDPSMDKAKDHRRDSNIWFYKMGLGEKDTVAANGWTIKTLESIVNLLNDTGKIIDYLKIDIENNEWSSLEAMYKSDILSRVKQFGLEVHTMPVGMTDTVVFHGRFKTLKKLEELGFRRWYWHFNHYGAYMFNGRTRSCCYELVYINTKFMTSTTAR